MRSGPSTNFSVVGSLSKADNVKVLNSYSNGWKIVEYSHYDSRSYSYNTKIGCVSGSYLSRNYPSALNYSLNSDSSSKKINTSAKAYWSRLECSGVAYQNNIDEKWQVKIYEISANYYRIEYPSLNCGGQLEVVTFDANQILFKESLTYGQSTCTNSGYVVLKKKDNKQFYFEYYWPSRDKLAAEGILTK